MLAATSSANITPPIGVIAQGHFPAGPTHSIHLPLELRTIVFAQDDRRIAIVTLDIIGIEREHTSRIRRQIEQQTDIPGDCVLIACSHTHTGPPTLNLIGPAPDAKYMAELERAAADSVVDARRRLEPVTLGLGASSAHFNINRRPTPGSNGAMVPNTAEIIDRRVRVLRVDNADDHPMALLFHYTCHPTSMASTQGYLTPDYPGVARTTVESRFDCHALFLPGCFGNIRPNILNDQNQFREATPDELDGLGRQLGDAVGKAAHYIRTFEAEALGANVREITMPFGETLGVDELKRMAADVSKEYRQYLANWARNVCDLLERGAMPESEVSQMQAMRLGPLAIVAIPGEPVLEIGHAIERAMTGHIDVDDIWPVGYANDMLGYLTTSRQKSEGGYEPTAFRHFLRPAAWSRDEETIIEAAVAMTENLGVR